MELQGVSLVTLSFFRDKDAATALADTVARYGGILGAAVCCTHRGGQPADDMTTCARDRDELLDRMFTLAKERDLLLDFHVDENGNEESKGLRHIADKTVEHGYQGRVVCGHCWCAPPNAILVNDSAAALLCVPWVVQALMAFIATQYLQWLTCKRGNVRARSGIVAAVRSSYTCAAL